MKKGKLTMTETFDIKLERVEAAELPQFTKELQKAFAIAVQEKFGESDPIPSEEEVRSSFYSGGGGLSYCFEWKACRRCSAADS